MIKKVLSWIGYVFMGIVLIFIVYAVICGVTKKELSLFGRKLYTIKTNSMDPTIEVDTVILVKKTDVTELDKGTVITFDFSDAVGIPNTHRIVGYYYKYLEDGAYVYESTYDYDTVDEFISANPTCEVVGYRTQGDNPECKLDLKPVMFESIHGVYVKNLVVITFLYGLLTNFFGFLLIILVPLFVLLVLQMVGLYKNRQEAKTEKELKAKENERKALEEKIKEEAIKEYLEKQK